MVHAEVILQGDGGKSLRGCFNLHTLLGFDGLVQAVGVAAAFHDASRLFVYNLHLSVYDDIFIVFLEHGVSLQQLVDGMYSFRFDGVVSQQCIFLFQSLLIGQVLFIFQFGKLCCDVGQHEECRVRRITAN